MYLRSIVFRLPAQLLQQHRHFLLQVNLLPQASYSVSTLFTHCSIIIRAPTLPLSIFHTYYHFSSSYPNLTPPPHPTTTMQSTVLFSLLSLFAITILSSPLPTAQNIQIGKSPPSYLPPLRRRSIADFPIVDTLDSSDANNALPQAAASFNKPRIGSGARIVTHPKLPEMRGSIMDFVTERR